MGGGHLQQIFFLNLFKKVITMTGKLMIKEKLISWPEQILSISIKSCRKSMWPPGYTVYIYICTYTLQQWRSFSVSRHPLICEDCGGLHADLQDLPPPHKLSSCAPFLTGGMHDDTSPIPTLKWMQVPSLHRSVHHYWSSWFCWQFTSLSLRCYSLACAADIAATLQISFSGWIFLAAFWLAEVACWQPGILYRIYTVDSSCGTGSSCGPKKLTKGAAVPATSCS